MYLMIICLGPMLPPASSDLPDNRPGRPIVVHLSEFGLASDGVYMATDVTTGTVVSYTAFPPLPKIRRSLASKMLATSGFPDVLQEAFIRQE